MADSGVVTLFYIVLDDVLDNKKHFLAISNITNNLFLLHLLLKREYLPRVEGFTEQTIPDFLYEDFRTHFRIGKQMFLRIVETLGMDLIRSRGGGLDRVIPEKQVLVFLSYMATQESMRQISLYFGIGKSTVHGILRNVKTCFIDKFLRTTYEEESNEKIALHLSKVLDTMVYSRQMVQARKESYQECDNIHNATIRDNALVISGSKGEGLTKAFESDIDRICLDKDVIATEVDLTHVVPPNMSISILTFRSDYSHPGYNLLTLHSWYSL